MKKFGAINFNLIPYVDFLTNILLIFILMMSFMSLNKKKDESSSSANVLYQVVMDWDGKSKTDMDLWAKDPTGHIVGFNNREGGEGSLISLAHDALGQRNNIKSDKTTIDVNQEIISIRGTEEGEYCINGHCYLNLDKAPVKVTCKLIKIKPSKEIIKVERIFNVSGDENTFFRFKFDKQGNITETNELPIKFVSNNKGEDSIEPPNQ